MLVKRGLFHGRDARATGLGLLPAMKLAVSMWSYVHPWKAGGFGISEFVTAAKEAGVDGVELLDLFYQEPANAWTGEHTAASIAHARRIALDALAANGLPCPIFSVANDFAQADETKRAKALDNIRLGIEEAGVYGAEVIRVFAGDVKEGVTFEQARAWIVEGLAQASRLAANAGVRLALENHGTLAGRSDQVRGLIKDVREAAGNDVLGANPDTGNFLLVDAVAHEAVAEVADLATMVHFKDFRRPKDDETAVYSSLTGTPYVGAAIGEGEVDLEACVRALRAKGFDGWLSIEFEGAEDPRTAIPRSVQAARKFLG